MPMTEGTAVDISNYSGYLEKWDIAWLRGNADLVIVRLSTEDGKEQRKIAAQQVGALAAAGIPWQGYLWAYHSQDPYQHWERAQELLPSGWPAYYEMGIWIDHEDPVDPAIDAFTWQSAYASLLRADGFLPGVYTGQWWIDQHRGAFAGGRARYWLEYPLWIANYSVPPGATVPGIKPWSVIAMHQYASVEQGPVLNSYDLSRIVSVH